MAGLLLMKNTFEIDDRTLIDILLDEQKGFDTPVGRFSEKAARSESYGQGPVFESLVPLSIPEEGQQYGFQVDLDRCSGCKGCVTACHSLNGLDDNETWRDVGTLIAEEGSNPHQQTVTSACHHCVDPACLNGCPVNAYEKDQATGIVLHLDDQCIGCQYCVLKCPYDVPKYNMKRGIVRKCDMCYSRLAIGESPACVEACPHEAIKIVIVDTEACRTAASQRKNLVPSAPDSGYTIPTSAYISKEAISENLVAADSSSLRIQPTHWPLVLMLVFTQWGLGGFLASAYLGVTLVSEAIVVPLSVSWLMMHLGLLASVAHLGKPLKAWRIFLGIKKSWLSREAMAFGVASAVATLAMSSSFLAGPAWLIQASLLASIVFSGLAVFCSAYLYHDTQRKFWRLSSSLGKFGGTTILAVVGFALVFDSSNAGAYSILLAPLFVVKVWIEIQATKIGSVRLTSADLIYEPLQNWWRARLVLGLLGVLTALIGSWIFPLPILAVGAVAFIFFGEILERALFFKAVDATKMPGGFCS